MLDIVSIADAVLSMATARGKDKTICPSEVARQLWPDDWRPHMAEVREAAMVLRSQGLVKITQGGKEMPGIKFVGPVRIQLK